MKGCEKLRTPCSVILRACEEMRTPCSVILSRRSAAKDLQMRCKWLVLRILRSFVVLRFAAATQDDGTNCPANFSGFLLLDRGYAARFEDGGPPGVGGATAPVVADGFAGDVRRRGDEGVQAIVDADALVGVRGAREEVEERERVLRSRSTE